MASKVYVSINGDVKEVVKGREYPKTALIFSPIEKSPKDYRKQQEKSFDEVSASLEKMINKIDKLSTIEYSS